MLVLKLNLPGRATQDGQLVAVADALEAVCDDWKNDKEETLAETGVVNRHKIADNISRNIELAESMTAALRLATEKYRNGEWATGEKSVEIQV